MVSTLSLVIEARTVSTASSPNFLEHSFNPFESREAT